jgi:pseudouridine synthase
MKSPQKTQRIEERLQKILSRSGVTSRRQAEEMIQAGRVRVNGHTVTSLGAKADPRHDRITVDGRPLRQPPRHAYLLLNKPVGVVTTLSDPEGRPTIRDVLGPSVRVRVFPVGRLDLQSSGLLLLTNDGELAQRLMHPRYGVRKTYRVKVSRRPEERTLRRLAEGIHLEEGRTAPAEVRIVSMLPRKTWLEITIAEGKKRQVRRMCEAVGLPVDKLMRIRLGPLKLGRLQPGQWRPLTDDELGGLRRVLGLRG